MFSYYNQIYRTDHDNPPGTHQHWIYYPHVPVLNNQLNYFLPTTMNTGYSQYSPTYLPQVIYTLQTPGATQLSDTQHPSISTSQLNYSSSNAHPYSSCHSYLHRSHIQQSSYNSTKRPRRSRELSNLVNVSSKQGLQIAVFNAHSVQSKTRRASIVDFIIDEHIDIMFITESWLNTTGDEAKLKDLTPTGYKITSVPRETKGGGLIAIFRDHLCVNLSTSFSFNHTSFELLQLTLTSPHIHFFCIYRVPPRKQNGLKNSDFEAELPDLLEHINLLRGKSIILGDFNVHYNNQQNSFTKKFTEIVHSYDFIQGVKESTFLRSGNTLDWILYRKDDNIFRNCRSSYMLTSDHNAVICQLHELCPPKKPVYQMVRDLRNIDKTKFKADIVSLQEDLGGNITAEGLHDGLVKLLDQHAPAKEKKVPHRKDPWYPDVADELRTAKRLRRRAERRRNKTGLEIDRQILERHKEIVTNIILSAKENYYLRMFSTKLDSKQFSIITNQILGSKRVPLLPNNISIDNLPNAFSKYFTDKIDTIRSNIDNDDNNSVKDPLANDTQNINCALNSFSPITSDELRKIISSSNKKTCPLDPIPTSLLIEFLDDLLPMLTIIINNSLSTGSFPTIFKQALVTPLLKKPSLDPIPIF